MKLKYCNKNAISKNRFKKIKQFIYFNDNTIIDANDCYYKIRPLFDLNNAVKQFGISKEQLTINKKWSNVLEGIV